MTEARAHTMKMTDRAEWEDLGHDDCEVCDEARARKAGVMTEARAREILGEISPETTDYFHLTQSNDGRDFFASARWRVEDGLMWMDGAFTIDQLEALAWWARNK